MEFVDALVFRGRCRGLWLCRPVGAEDEERGRDACRTIGCERAQLDFTQSVWGHHASSGRNMALGKEVGYEGEVAGGDGGGVED